MPALPRTFRLLACALLLASLGFPGCSKPQYSGKPIVLCSIFAYYDAARAIAGDKCEVRILMPVSTSPHEYESTVSDKVTASKATLYIKNGMGLDDRFDKLFDGSKAKIVSISNLIPKDMFLTTEEISLEEDATQPATKAASEPAHAHDHEHGDIIANPHIWLDPLVQIKAAEIIGQAMGEMDAANKAYYQQNAEKYIAELKKLDGEFAVQALKFKNREFIGFHSAYDYLAHHYGLRQVAAIEELPGSDITIGQTNKIIRLIKEKQIKFIAVESAFSANSAKLIERETGAKEIVLQPLETYDNQQDTYLGYMRKNLEALQTILGQ